MHFIKKDALPKSNTPLKLIMTDQTDMRLRLAHFRGFTKKLAGNFKRWGTPIDLLNDSFIYQRLLKNIGDIVDEKDWGKFSLTLRYPDAVGWSSTSPLKNFVPEDLEQFNPNKRSQALRLKPTRTDILVPETKDVTLVCNAKELTGTHLEVIVYSMYPGADVGDLYQDVTAREQIVFFDFNHPGA